jgi:hypothetical protein
MGKNADDKNLLIRNNFLHNLFFMVYLEQYFAKKLNLSDNFWGDKIV